MSELGYFLVADLLGFGRIVVNSSESELQERIAAWTNLVEASAQAHGIERLQLISDTCFAAMPSSEEGLASLVAFSRALLSEGLERSLPVRGAIVHGSYSWGKLTYGSAVISAHSLEQSQNWLGVACGGDLPHIASLWSLDKLVCYPVPLKHSPMRLHPAVSWEVPNTERLMLLLMGGGLTRRGEVLTWELGEKANNTVLFRLYQQFLRKTGAACSHFYGTLPVHHIEAGLSTGEAKGI